MKNSFKFDADSLIKKVNLFETDFTVVSESQQKDKSNTLYVYAEVIDGITYLKFGEAFSQTVWQRYNATGNTQHNKIIKVWKSSVHDKPIHAMLKKNFHWAGNKYQNPLTTNEAYIISSLSEVNNFLSVIDSVVSQGKIGPDFFRNRFGETAYTPRSYQTDVMNKAKSILSNKDRVLINLSTRAGKSYVSLKICKDLGAKNILILTPFPSAEDSFEKLGDYNLEFTGYKYTHLSAKTKSDDFCDKNIMFCSYQFYNDDKSIIKEIKDNINFDFVILDECHHTSDSERTTNIILKNIHYDKLIYMSGTPFNDIYSGYFNKDEVVTFDFVDFIKYAKSHPEEISLPELNIKNVCNLEDLQNNLISMDPELFKKADVFDFPTIFSDEQHAESFFKWLFQPIENGSLITYKKRWFDLSNQKRIIAFFSTNAQVAVAKKALEKYYKGKVIAISGDAADKEFSSADEETINKAFEEENVVILTCGKLTTGVTLPALDTVWYFKSSSSAEQFIQILFRTMTEYKGKTEASMYCFDTEASLKVVKEYAAIRLDEMSTNVTKDEENDTFQSVINDILSCINFTYLDKCFNFSKENPEDYFEKLHKLPYNFSVLNAFTNFHAFDGVSDLGTEQLCDKDLTVSKSQNTAIRGQCEGNNNLKKLLKQVNKNNKKTSKPEEMQSEKVVKQVLKILINLDKKILVNDNIKSYSDLASLWPPRLELAKYKNNFIALLSDNKTRLNQMIEDIRFKKVHNLPELLNALSFSNSTDMKTPPQLLEKMFDKFSNVDGVICDPCCGIGTIFEYALYKLNKAKSAFYGIELEADNVAICHMLGFENVIQGDAEDPKTWEKLVNILYRNTMKKNFDKIIMNPPYDKNLHLKILREAMKHSDDVVNLSPIRWLQDPLAEYKKNSDWKKFEDIRKRIETLDVVGAEDAQAFFGSGQYENLGIYHLTEKGGADLLPKPFISQGLFDKVNLPTYQGKYKSLYDVFKEGHCDFSRPFVKFSPLQGGVGHKSWYNIMSPQKELAFTDKVVKGRGTAIGTVNFDTQEEAENFFAYCQTKFVKACNGNVKTNIRWPGYAIPFMPTYEHPWTDEMLYEYFGLTPDEIKEIEQEIR